MKPDRIVSLVLVGMATASLLLSSRGQTGSATATVGTAEIQFVFPLDKDDPEPPGPLPPPPEPPPSVPRISPPSSPANLSITGSNERELMLAWESAEAAPGHRVVYYEVLRNGVKIAESNGTRSTQPYDSEGPVIEFFSVRAVDDQRARSSPSNEVSAPRAGDSPRLFFQAKTAFGRRDMPGVEEDLLQAQAQLGLLAWGQTCAVSNGESEERNGLPLAERGLGELAASDYRFGVPAGKKRQVRWAEIFIPGDGGEDEVLVINEEWVDATAGVAFTAVHHVDPPDRPGLMAVALLEEFAEAIPAVTTATRAFAPNTMFIGQGTHLRIAVTPFVPGDFGPPGGDGGPGPGVPPPGGGGYSLPPPYRFHSIVITLTDPAHAAKLFAIDPTVEASAGLAQAMAQGQEIVSGTDLMDLQLPNGMAYGEWRLVVLGQGVGTVELSVEYEHSPWTRVTTALEVYPALEMAVDANRDHRIALPSESAADTTTTDTPFRFWLNDDIDHGHTVDGTDYEQDDIGPKEAAAEHWAEDWRYNFITSERDLEDFAGLSLATHGWERRLKTGEFSLGFKWTAVTGDPAIKLYRQSDPGGGTAYLTDSPQATLQLLQPALLDERSAGDDLRSFFAHTIIGSDDIFILPAAFWTDSAAPRSLLFEGCHAGRGCLQPVLLRRDRGNYVELAEMAGIWFDLKNVGEMYEHWSVGNGNGAVPTSAATRVAAESGDGHAFSYAADDPEERKYILYVHGWNMEKWEKERFAETAYKRLYWQGYRGRFGLFSWPTTYGFESTWDAIADSTNYDRGEFAAWRSAVPLRVLLQELAATYDGELYVFSHSMGGVTTSEALRLQSDARGPQIAKVYVAGQAALSAHAYDGMLPETAGAPDALQWHYTHPRLQVPGNYGPGTPDVYRNWAAFITTGSASSSVAVGRVVSFYNENDYALSAPVWQFNQLTKPDFADFPDLLWEYRYEGDPTAAPTSTGFRKVGKLGNHAGEVTLRLGTRTAPADRYEIMAFAAESHVKAMGATSDLQHGISGAVNLRTLWPIDHEDHKTHRWHSAEFRSTIQNQRNCWRVLLGKTGFDISTVTLP